MTFYSFSSCFCVPQFILLSRNNKPLFGNLDFNYLLFLFENKRQFPDGGLQNRFMLACLCANPLWNCKCVFISNWVDKSLQRMFPLWCHFLVCFEYYIQLPKILAQYDNLIFSFQYIKMRTQRISLLLKKRFTTPNWIKVCLFFAMY